ncbi:MAG: FHA domain-containing protein, partial [Thermoleophilaceae bacterium]
MSEILFIEKAPAAGAEHRVKDGATIGRKGCDVELADPDVSRRHAVLRRDGSGIAVEDLASTNGTLVNGLRIDAVTELRDGDRVQFGSVVW